MANGQLTHQDKTSSSRCTQSQDKAQKPTILPVLLRMDRDHRVGEHFTAKAKISAFRYSNRLEQTNEWGCGVGRALLQVSEPEPER